MVKIIVKLKDKLISEITVGKDTVTIGRDPKSDVRLENPAVSRCHAKITKLAEAAYYIDDLNSTNGTFVNGKRVVARTGLNNNDMITIGKHTLIFVDESWKTRVISGDGESPTISVN